MNRRKTHTGKTSAEWKSGQETKNGYEDAAKRVIHKVHRDRKHHDKKKDSQTIIKVGSAGLIANKAGHNGFHYRILAFESDQKIYGSSREFEKSFDEVQQASYCTLRRNCDS